MTKDTGAIVKAEKQPLVQLGQRGLNLNSIEDALVFAKGLIESNMAPRGMTKPGAIVAIIEAGLELGVPPMWALSNLTFTNGRLSCMGDLALAIVRAKGGLKPGFVPKVEYTGEKGKPSWTCTVTLWKNGASEPRSSSFSIQDAIRARLMRINEKGQFETYKSQGGWGLHNAPWQSYPQRMLYYRPLGFLLRDDYAEYLMGLTISEEVSDFAFSDEPRREKDITPPKAPPRDQDPLLEMAARASTPTPAESVDETGETPPEVPAESTASAREPDVQTDQDGGRVEPEALPPETEPQADPFAARPGELEAETERKAASGEEEPPPLDDGDAPGDLTGSLPFDEEEEADDGSCEHRRPDGSSAWIPDGPDQEHEVCVECGNYRRARRTEERVSDRKGRV